MSDARERLLDAALTLIRVRGYEATSVEDLCDAAAVSKGAFFHHFRSKEALAVAAADHWTERTTRLFAEASYHQRPDPLERVYGYLEFRKQLIQGDLPQFTCLVGTMAQEIYRSHTPIRKACAESIFGHAAILEQDIALAQKKYIPKAKWSARSLAQHTQAVLQGAFILAKAGNDPQFALQSLEHLRQYIQLLFTNHENQKITSKRGDKHER